MIRGLGDSRSGSNSCKKTEASLELTCSGISITSTGRWFSIVCPLIITCSFWRRDGIPMKAAFPCAETPVSRSFTERLPGQAQHSHVLRRATANLSLGKQQSAQFQFRFVELRLRIADRAVEQLSDFVVL